MISVADGAGLSLPVSRESSASLRNVALLVGGGAVIFLSRWLARPALPDDYDSINFLFGMSRGYDLALFQPQFPGYPVYVALGTALHGLGLSALNAAELISSAASAATGMALATIAWRFGGKGAARAALLIQLGAWLPWLLGSGALSDASGTALAAIAFALFVGTPWGAERRFPFAAGLAMGLALGVRASYWPFAIALGYLAFRVREGSTFPKASAGFGTGLAAWGIPFVLVVGAHRLVDLGRTHVAGHFEQWGGTIVTRPNIALRFGTMLRGLAYDGLAPWLPATLALCGIVAVAVWLRPRGERWKAQWTAIALVLAPYALWAFFAQNIVEQPRHLLPLVEGEILLVGLLIGEHALFLVAVFALVVGASAPFVWLRRTVPPAAAQAVDWVKALPRDEKVTWVTGTRSIRFFQAFAPEVTTRQQQWLSPLIGELVRVDRIPDRILLTSEVDLHSGAGPRVRVPTHWHVDSIGQAFCRDARIDRGQPCLQLSQLSWGP